MAWNLGPYVTWGEVVHLRRNLVHGRLYLAHCRMPLWFALTGNGGPGLVGRHLRFVPRQPRPAGSPYHAPPLTPQQTGVLARGDYSAGQGGACSGPAQLRLEWFGPEGRVRLMLEDPQVEFLEALPESAWWSGAAEADVLPQGMLASPPAAGEDSRANRPSTALGEQQAAAGASDEAWLPSPLLPLAELMRPPLVLKPADELDDWRLQQALWRGLARLARYGVALDVCPHFSPRDAYRVLVERLLPDLEVPPSMLGEGWAHMLTTETFCPHCQRDWSLEEDEFPP